MNISKSVHNVNDSDVAKEIWMYTPELGASYLCSNKNVSISDIGRESISTVSERMKHRG